MKEEIGPYECRGCVSSRKYIEVAFPSNIDYCFNTCRNRKALCTCISQWLVSALKGEVTFAFLKELIEILKTDWKLNGKKGTA